MRSKALLLGFMTSTLCSSCASGPTPKSCPTGHWGKEPIHSMVKTGETCHTQTTSTPRYDSRGNYLGADTRVENVCLPLYSAGPVTGYKDAWICPTTPTPGSAATTKSKQPPPPPPPPTYVSKGARGQVTSFAWPAGDATIERLRCSRSECFLLDDRRRLFSFANPGPTKASSSKLVEEGSNVLDFVRILEPRWVALSAAGEVRMLRPRSSSSAPIRGKGGVRLSVEDYGETAHVLVDGPSPLLCDVTEKVDACVPKPDAKTTVLALLKGERWITPSQCKETIDHRVSCTRFEASGRTWAPPLEHVRPGARAIVPLANGGGASTGAYASGSDVLALDESGRLVHEKENRLEEIALPSPGTSLRLSWTHGCVAMENQEVHCWVIHEPEWKPRAVPELTGAGAALRGGRDLMCGIAAASGEIACIGTQQQRISRETARLPLGVEAWRIPNTQGTKRLYVTEEDDVCGVQPGTAWCSIPHTRAEGWKEKP